MDSLIEVVVTEKVLEKHPARDWGYTRSPYLFLLGIIGPSLKGFMLAIDIASPYGFLCFTLDQ